VSSFAGISFVHEEFNNCGLLQLTDEQPGKRNASGYGHGELFRTWFEIFFCGGEVAEDVQEHLRPTSESIPGNRAAAPDTLLRKIKESATEDTIVTSSYNEEEYLSNFNEKMNNLNIKSLMLTSQLEKGKKYDLDYDNQIIEHEKWNARRTYKHTTGYFAGIGSTGVYSHPKRDRLQTQIYALLSCFRPFIAAKAPLVILPNDHFTAT
jgi:hypothetical protein